MWEFPTTSYNYARTLRFLIFGMYIAPLATRWNAYLERHFPLRPLVQPAPTEPIPLESVTIDSDTPVFAPEVTAPALPPIDKLVLARRLAWDQLFMAPISFIVFLASMAVMEGKPFTTWYRIENYLIPILLTNYKVWPIIQVAQFLWIPLKYRVALSGVLNVIWNIYLSWQTMNASKVA
ncbi:hypothetical protein MNV49_006854 [Pseudohyphozyma bogoriensis]|nr:hypothetical protein MNV49_006854 [Pseudohyphozyma bogoriensis]